MSRFEKCPKLAFEKCSWYADEQCEGCPIYTAYYIGRADGIKDVLTKTRGAKDGKAD